MLNDISLNSIKSEKSMQSVVDDERKAESPDTLADGAELEDIRTKFVGEVDLPERKSLLQLLLLIH